MRATLAIVFSLLIAPLALAQMPPEPTAFHRDMAREVGVWDAKVTVWTAPDAEPEHSTGVETITAMGPLWTVGKFQGDFAGMPFEGRSQMGYDPAEKQYIGTWIDSVSPYLMTMQGSYDPSTHQLTMESNCRCWQTNEPQKGRMVTTYLDENSKVFETFGPDDEGNEFRSMRIEYTRRGE
ncbi:hypothetical protein Pla108_02910 [Botrimarina colliarenosi]|uniref:DUF1579 domain-containing protein n=1 Tax=Botrimarina colliarenosi TaxID=2528001 RepID=A0A5C6AH87_9BACT|nr:DUF1579 domain-containing protein [Botrimarina colliarenosi]TWT99354.1 hypothetical protein Pla108_02910 [Botrimarina colliarenosi]